MLSLLNIILPFLRDFRIDFLLYTDLVFAPDLVSAPPVLFLDAVIQTLACPVEPDQAWPSLPSPPLFDLRL